LISQQEIKKKGEKKEKKMFFWRVCDDDAGEGRGFLGFAWTDTILQQTNAVFLCCWLP